MLIKSIVFVLGLSLLPVATLARSEDDESFLRVKINLKEYRDEQNKQCLKYWPTATLPNGRSFQPKYGARCCGSGDVYWLECLEPAQKIRRMFFERFDADSSDLTSSRLQISIRFYDYQVEDPPLWLRVGFETKDDNDKRFVQNKIHYEQGGWFQLVELEHHLKLFEQGWQLDEVDELSNTIGDL